MFRFLRGDSEWPWWLLAAVSALIAAGFIWLSRHA